MIRRLGIEIQGIGGGMLMHNGRLANPLDEWAKALSKITGKKKKTDDDRVEMSRLEFMGGLYLDEKGRPCIPGELIEGFFGRAARTIRKGKEGVAGVSSDGNWPLLYDGPKSADKLWEKTNTHVHVCGAKVKRSKVMRTRPRFPEWSLKFEILYNDEILDLDDVKAILAAGEVTNGLGDFIPKFGRFRVVSIEDRGVVGMAA